MTAGAIRRRLRIVGRRPLPAGGSAHTNKNLPFETAGVGGLLFQPPTPAKDNQINQSRSLITGGALGKTQVAPPVLLSKDKPMTIQSNKNLMARFLQSLQELGAMAKNLLPKERAVTIWDIVRFVQKQLEDQGEVDEFGFRESAGYVMDGYIDNTGTFVIYTKDGKLYKLPVFVDEQSQISTGEAQEVFMEFTPVSRSLEDSRGIVLRVVREESGAIRWLATPACTAFLNRSGEIDSRALFDSFIEYAERTNEFPELDFFHLGERLTFGKADMLFRDGVNFCATGLFYEDEISRAAAEALEKQGDFWGLSIAYLPTKEPEIIRSDEGIEIPVFNNGICRFISLLPENTAASILTSISTEEVNRMNKIKKDALVLLVGQAKADEIEKSLDANTRAASEPGVIMRQAQTQAQAQPAPAAAPAAQAPAAETPKARAFTDEDVTALAGALFGSDQFKSSVKDIFTEMRDAETPDGEEDESESEGEAETEETVVAEARALAPDLATQILAKLEELGKDREADVQQVLDDLPSKIAKARIVRPRGQVIVNPELLKADQRQQLDLSAIAAQTREKVFSGGA